MKRLVETFETHEILNPKLWEGFDLKPEVAEKLLKVVDIFKERSKIDFKIIDILLVGSNASFNYTNSSDIDVHIVTNFSELKSEEDIIQAFFDLDKAKFNSDYDISIYGLEVEVYVEDINESTISNGIYSLKRNMWIKKPELIQAEDFDISAELNEYTLKIQTALLSDDSTEIDHLLDEIHLIRKDALAAEGEFSKGNQLFKELRSSGLIKKLKERKKELISKELTLESLLKNASISELFKADFN